MVKFSEKKLIISIVLILCLLLVFYVFYRNSDHVKGKEYLNYLHEKYGFSYDSMTIKSYTDYSEGWLSSGITYDGAYVKYNDIEIYVYDNPEDGKLHDDYVDLNSDCFGTKTDIKSILRKYIDDFHIIIDSNNTSECTSDKSFFSEQSYIIFIYSTDNNQVKNIIDGIKYYVDYYSKGLDDPDYTVIGVYILKDRDLFDEIKKKDFSKLGEKKGKQTYPTDLYDVLGYSATRITALDDYNEDVFNYNGDSSDDEYQDPNHFKYVTFWFDIETNSKGHYHFYTFGLEKK